MDNQKLKRLVGAGALGHCPGERDEADAAFDALQADALRYRGIRLILLERDEATRNRMLAAFECYTDSVPLLNNDWDEEINKLTPGALDTIVDGLLLAIAEARNADGPT